MFVGKVVGTVWSSVKWPGMTGHKLLLVRPYHLADLLAHPLRSGADASDQVTPSPSAVIGPPSHTSHEAVVCIDLLDAGVGDDVVVAFGHAARVAADSRYADETRTGASQFRSGPAHLPDPMPPTPTTTPVDAAVVAVVDGFHIVRPGT
jgi:microcompartment protein CcmK/EutM